MPFTIMGDSDGDGVISFEWEKRQTGIDVKLIDTFNNTVVATFYKHELLDSLKELVRKLENELESRKSGG